MTTRESLSSYASRLGWSVSTRECTDTYTAGDRSVFVDFADNGYAIGGGLHGELYASGDDETESWVRYHLAALHEDTVDTARDWIIAQLQRSDDSLECTVADRGRFLLETGGHAFSVRVEFAGDGA